MPGNPLPEVTKNLKDSNFPYTPEDGWGSPPVTAAPKAVFDANSQPTSLLGDGLTSGYIKITENTLNTSGNIKYPNIEIPGAAGERGWLFSFNAKNPLGDNQGMEVNYGISIPQRRIWDYQRLYQPTNYFHRRFWEIDITSESDLAGWDIGDEIESRGARGVFVGFDNDPGSGEPRGIIKPITAGQGPYIFESGQTITNVTKGTSITSIGGGNPGTNQKFMSAWVDDSSINGGGHNGYSNSGIFVGITAEDWTEDTKDPAGTGYVIFSSQANLNGGKPYGGGYFNNDTDYGGKYTTPFFDVADNGHFVNIVYERSRNTSENSSDTQIRIWKMVERQGSPFEQWKLLFEGSGDVWSPYQNNCFTHGYLFGNSNAGYNEQTDWYLNRWEFWTQKPKFLVEEGL